jgi:threonine synthase
MGIALCLAIAERSPAWPGVDATTPLAISSCGNAALAAAVVARAVRRPLRAAIPTWADAVVVARLEALGATLEVCSRSATSPPGDPCHHRFRENVEGGALPFACQGNENGLTIDGGMTLGWELVDQLRERSLAMDRLLVQVGGGALASACIQALRWARELGVLEQLPVIHAVQTASAHPLERAWRLVAERIVSVPPQEVDPAALAARVHRADSTDLETALEHAAAHRSQYMRPVTEPPCSVATGILDDEAYDWREIVRGMLETGGWPLVVDEETLVRARDHGAPSTGIAVDATGSAGLAGVYALASADALRRDETIAVLFTGAQREAGRG